MSYAGGPVRNAVRRLKRWLPRRRGPAVLMYHRIGSEPFDPWGLGVEQERFARQLEWLARNRTVVPLGELAARVRDGLLSDDLVALTFDDGYASVAGVVPLLERLGLHATIFLPAELIESRDLFWWDELAQIVMRSPADSLTLDGAELPVPPADPRDSVWAAHTPPRTRRQKLFHTLWSRIRKRPPAELRAAMAELRIRVPHQPNGSDRPLRPEEVRSIGSDAVEFGSHALNHPYLPALGRQEKAREIKDSIARCASLTGRAPTAFSYPYGVVDAESVRLVEDAGFQCACATGNAIVSARSSPFALPRLYVGDWEPALLSHMLGGS